MRGCRWASVKAGHFATGVVWKEAFIGLVVEEILFYELPAFRGCQSDSCMESKHTDVSFRNAR
jgi:hypothetical protein